MVLHAEMCKELLLKAPGVTVSSTNVTAKDECVSR